MTTIILDAGALIAVERNDRTFLAAVRVAQRSKVELRTNANVVGQVWRTGSGRQAQLARFLPGVTIEAVSDDIGFAAGRLLSRSHTDDVIDATVALMANDGDFIFTSDEPDIGLLLQFCESNVEVIRC